MAENGILDYQGMNQAIYRGATSNIVVDTQSMSIEIGAGNTSHTSNLHFECDHDANVASIKLNSNVVTEFSRSKKLIKYPRVAMTGETTSNYTVTSSSWYGSGTQYEPWKAFDNVGNHPTGQLAWYSLDYSAPEAYSGTDNAFNPSHGGTATPVLFTGAVQGEWLKIQLPHKVALDHYIMYGPNQESEFPRDWTVYGSVNGTNWDRVDSRVSQIFGAGTGAGGTATGKTKEFYLDTLTDEYLYFAFVFTRGSPNRTQYIGVGEIELYGTPEYDPEAHGVDVTIKSVPNVPNTDWLEVYYDAKDLTTMPNPVTDLAGGDQDASVYGVTLDTTNEAFVFNGSSYLETDIPQITTGVWPFTMSFWFKVNAHIGTTWNYLAHLGIRGTAGDSTLVGLQNDQISFTTWADSKINSGVVATPGVWYHVTSTWPGGAFYDNAKLYINAVSYGDVDNTRDEADPLSFPTSGNKLTLGKQMNTTSDYFNGSIANFRLFNRALTTDEIHQLYAYQKEYFGHGDLSMTLKAGRLGIGTSEPKAALDVRGPVRIYDTELTNLVYAEFSTNYATTGLSDEQIAGWRDPANNILDFNVVTRQSSHNAFDADSALGVRGSFTVPHDGVYVVYYAALINRVSTTSHIYVHVNGSNANGTGINSHQNRNTIGSTWITLTIQRVLRLKRGDKVQCYITGGFYTLNNYSFGSIYQIGA